jgi:hypothetical protein
MGQLPELVVEEGIATVYVMPLLGEKEEPRACVAVALGSSLLRKIVDLGW